MRLPWQYQELLEAIGINDHTFLPEPSRINILSCCSGDIRENKDSMTSCWNCGRVLEIQKIVNEEEPTFTPGVPLGAQSQYSPIKKKRVYKRLTHFKEHVRRFLGKLSLTFLLGARFTPLPENILTAISKEVDIMSRDCYHQVKSALKKIGCPKLYKEIFTIIYKLGGIKSKVQDVNTLYQMYTEFDYYYEQSRKTGNITRRNGVSFYMVLDLFLKELGYPSYYYLPYLKNEELQREVLRIISQLRYGV